MYLLRLTLFSYFHYPFLSALFQGIVTDINDEQREFLITCFDLPKDIIYVPVKYHFNVVNFKSGNNNIKGQIVQFVIQRRHGQRVEAMFVEFVSEILKLSVSMSEKYEKSEIRAYIILLIDEIYKNSASPMRQIWNNIYDLFSEKGYICEIDAYIESYNTNYASTSMKKYTIDASQQAPRGVIQDWYMEHVDFTNYMKCHVIPLMFSEMKRSRAPTQWFNSYDIPKIVQKVPKPQTRNPNAKPLHVVLKQLPIETVSVSPYDPNPLQHIRSDAITTVNGHKFVLCDGWNSHTSNQSIYNDMTFLDLNPSVRTDVSSNIRPFSSGDRPSLNSPSEPNPDLLRASHIRTECDMRSSENDEQDEQRLGTPSNKCDRDLEYLGDQGNSIRIFDDENSPSGANDDMRLLDHNSSTRPELSFNIPLPLGDTPSINSPSKTKSSPSRVLHVSVESGSILSHFSRPRRLPAPPKNLAQVRIESDKSGDKKNPIMISDDESSPSDGPLSPELSSSSDGLSTSDVD
jgi:hypothetical protein